MPPCSGGGRSQTGWMPTGRPVRLASAPCAQNDGSSSALLFVSSMEGEERRDFRIEVSDGALDGASVELPVRRQSLENGLLTLRFDQAMQPVGLGGPEIELADGLLIRSAVNYSGRIAEASFWEIVETGILGSGIVGFMKLKAEIPFRADGEKTLWSANSCSPRACPTCMRRRASSIPRHAPTISTARGRARWSGSTMATGAKSCPARSGPLSSEIGNDRSGCGSTTISATSVVTISTTASPGISRWIHSTITSPMVGSR